MRESKLTHLNLSDNKLSSLKLRHNSILVKLVIYNNPELGKVSCLPPSL
jgi:Leucine-rich repeat (LRR) protein